MSIRLGLTGGIASGKSYVSQMLRDRWHIPVYDSDSQAKRLNQENEAIRNALISLVGRQVYDDQGRLNKPLLASYLFASPLHACQVNSIIHPVVRDDFRAWALSQTSPVIGFESAILYESGFDGEVDYVLYVDAPRELRIRRAMNRDASTRTQVLERMARQEADAYRSRADWVVNNDESAPSVLQASLEEVMQKLHYNA